MKKLSQSLSLVVVLTVLLFGAGCEPQEGVEPQSAAPHDEATEQATEAASSAVLSTGTEVVFYGLVSWAVQSGSDGNPNRLVALMPDTSNQPECIGDEDQTPVEGHHPVLKVVTGDFEWSGTPLGTFEGQRGIFSLKGQDLKIAGDGFAPLATTQFELISSTGALSAIKPAALTTRRVVALDPAYLADPAPADLGARVVITHGAATASVSCPNPQLFRAESAQVGESLYNCPQTDGKPGRPLADQVLVRLLDTGAPVRISFSNGGVGDLTVRPATPGGAVRIEIANQMKSAAVVQDTRTGDACDHSGTLRDYLWYYDLRQGEACPDPTLFPCPVGALNGTKCPEHNWNG